MKGLNVETRTYQHGNLRNTVINMMRPDGTLSPGCALTTDPCHQGAVSITFALSDPFDGPNWRIELFIISANLEDLIETLVWRIVT